MSPEEVITQYDRMIQQAARRLLHRTPRDFELDDLVQHGRIVVWQVVDKILAIEDPIHRSNYVRQRIYGAMVDAMRKGHMGPRKSTTMVYGLDQDVYELHFGARDEPYGVLLCKEVLARALARLTEGERAYLVWLLEEDDGTVPYHEVRGVSPSRVSQWRKTIEAAFVRGLESFTETDAPPQVMAKAWATVAAASPVSAAALAAWHRYSRKTP